MLDANNRKVLQFSVKKNFAIGLATAFMIVSGMTDAYGKNGKVGVRIDAIQESAWDCSEWISVADAPVVTGPIGGANERAADGGLFSTARSMTHVNFQDMPLLKSCRRRKRMKSSKERSSLLTARRFTFAKTLRSLL